MREGGGGAGDPLVHLGTKTIKNVVLGRLCETYADNIICVLDPTPIYSNLRAALLDSDLQCG